MSLRNAAAGLACIGVLLAVSGAGAASDTAASPRHLIYLHGRIVQDQQSPRPRSPRFGYYELEKIHTGLSHGFLYRPMPEWVNPAAEWAGAAE